MPDLEARMEIQHSKFKNLMVFVTPNDIIDVLALHEPVIKISDLDS